MEEKTESLWELFTGISELTPEQELYCKMIGLTYDIRNGWASKEDIKFFKEHYHKFQHEERIRLFEHKDLSEE